MNPVPVGTRVRVARKTSSHNYTVGKTFVVSFIDDSDGTLRLTDSQGQPGNWIKWDDCEPATESIWSILKRDLPQEIVLFLSAFEGVEWLTLREDVVDEILQGLPDLDERIVAFARTEEGAQSLGLKAEKDGGGESDAAAARSGRGTP